MTRHIMTQALVLKAENQGENSRMIWLLTPEKGLLTALAPGAAKSNGKLRILTAAFCQVTAKLYHDPVKDWYRVEDLEEVALNREIGENLDRYTVASLWCEILLGAHGGGQSEGTFELVCRALTAISKAEGPKIRAYNLVFLWKLMENWGWAPEFEYCGSCGKSIQGLEVFYNRREGEFFCSDCAGELMEHWPADAVSWIQKALGGRLTGECSALAQQVLWKEAITAFQTHLGRDLKSLALFTD